MRTSLHRRVILVAMISLTLLLSGVYVASAAGLRVGPAGDIIPDWGLPSFSTAPLPEWSVPSWSTSPAEPDGSPCDSLKPITLIEVDGGWGYWSAYPVTVSLNATRGLEAPPVAMTQYSIDGTAPALYEEPRLIENEGITEFTFWSTDVEGTREVTRTAYVAIDMTPPETMSDSVPEYTDEASIMLGAIDALSGVSAIMVSVDGKDYQVWDGNPILFGPSASPHTLAYYSYDNAGNIEDAQYEQFTVTGTDITPPITTVSYTGDSLGMGDYFTFYSSDVLVTLTADDTSRGDSASTTIFYSFDWADTVGIEYTGPFAVTKEGFTDFTYWSVDAAGNREYVQAGFVLIDKTSPETVDDSSGFYPNGSAIISLTATDPEPTEFDPFGASGIMDTQYRLNGVDGWGNTVVSSTVGTNTLDYWSTDWAGNIEDFHSIEFSISRPEYGPPTTTISELPTGWVNYDVPFTLTAEDADTPDGIVSKYAFGTLYGDYYGEGPMLVSDSDFEIGSSGTVTREGFRAVFYNSTDAWGNEELYPTQTDPWGGPCAYNMAFVAIDKTRPAAWSNVSGGMFAGPVTPVIDTIDTLSSVKDISYSLDGEATTTVSATTVTLSEVSTPGVHTVRYVASDNAGNESAPKTATFTIESPYTRYQETESLLVKDGAWTPSSAAFHSGGSYSYLNGAGSMTVAFTGTAIDWITIKDRIYGIASVSLDGGTPEDVDLYSATFAPQSKAWGASGLTDGPHTLTISWTGDSNIDAEGTYIGVDAFDVIGTLAAVPGSATRYEETDSLLVKDGAWTPSSAGFHSSGAYSYLNGAGSMTVAFEGTAIDWITIKDRIYGIASVSLDGGTPEDVDLYSATFAPQSKAWGASGLTDGPHTLTISWTGESNIDAEGTYIGVDAFDVMGTVTAVPGSATRYEEANSLLVKDGPWTPSSAGFHSDGSYSYLNMPGSMTVAFEGTAIDWITIKDKIYGIAMVSLDGSMPEDVDLYSATFAPQSKAWGVSGLTDGPHTLTISWTGRANIDAEGTYIGVDAFDLTGILTAVPATGTRYEETDPLLVKDGAWTPSSADFHSGGSYIYLNGTGSVTVAFTGTGIDWITIKDQIYGIANVSLDGGTPANVDLYSETFAPQSKVWGVSGLTDGPHTLTIAWTPLINPAASGTYIGIDAFDVTGELTSVPTSGTRYEDTDPLLVKDGAWTSSSAAFHSGGSYSYLDGAGSMTVAFDGTGIDWITIKDKIYGIAMVSLDGAMAEGVDLYSDSFAPQSKVWGVSGLTDGPHTITIYWVGSANPDAEGTYIGVDAFDVTGTLTSAP